jgi:hypothetical protein
MKIHIWQQFSSNHSNTFTLVGQFKDETAAIEAAKRFEAILNTMLVNAKQPNAAELLKIQMEKLGLAWQHNTLPDWLQVTPEIKRYGDVLFVDAYNNWSSHKPLDLLLDKLGSKGTASDSELDGINSRWTWEFDIMDVAQADAFEALVLEVLTMNIEDYYEKYAEFPTSMMSLLWRDDEKKPVMFEREKLHFQIINASFYHGMGLLDTISNFRAWLEECGASNISYSVSNKSS